MDYIPDGILAFGSSAYTPDGVLNFGVNVDPTAVVVTGNVVLGFGFAPIANANYTPPPPVPRPTASRSTKPLWTATYFN